MLPNCHRLGGGRTTLPSVVSSAPSSGLLEVSPSMASSSLSLLPSLRRPSSSSSSSSSPSSRRLIPPPPALLSPSLETSQPSSRRWRHSSFPVLSAVPSTPDRGGDAAAAKSEDGVAKLLEGVEVFDAEGRAIPVLDLWRDRTAVVGFARHFGCVLCRKRADLLASKKGVMDEAGVALVLIGPGSISQAKAFMEQTQFKGEVYADPSHSSFKALNFVSGILATFSPMAASKVIESYMEGYRQDWGISFETDTVLSGSWRQGGILVAGPGSSNISYFHKDKEAGDDPDVEEVMRACCA